MAFVTVNCESAAKVCFPPPMFCVVFLEDCFVISLFFFISSVMGCLKTVRVKMILLCLLELLLMLLLGILIDM